MIRLPTSDGTGADRLERRCARLSDCVILIARAAADPNCTNHFPVSFQRNSARENHDPAIIRGVNTEELSARLRVLCQVLCSNIECAGSIGLFLRDIDTADPSTVHAD